MRDLQRLKNRFVTAAVLLAVIDIALLVFLMRPGYGREAQQAQETSLQQQLSTLKRDVGLLKKSDPASVRKDPNRLYSDDVATRLSEVSKRIEKLCQDTGVVSQAIRYSTDTNDKTALPDVQQEQIDTTVTGDYIKIARFINAMEQDKLLFLIDKISLNSHQEAGTPSGTVSLHISFSAFLREGAVDGAKART